MNLARRLFLKSGALAPPAVFGFLVGSVQSQVGDALIQMYGSAASAGADYFRKNWGSGIPVYSDDQKRLGKQLLIGNGDNFAVLPATANPFATLVDLGGSKVSLPSAVVAQSVRGLLSEAQVDIVNDVSIQGIKGKNVLMIGSSASNIFAKYLFGENGVSVLQEDLPRNLHFQFPVWFGSRPDNPSIENSRKRSESDSGIPAYALWSKGKSGEKYFPLIPNIEGGLLKEDYLVLTSIPAIQSEEDYELDRRVVSVAGVHRYGTLAIHNLICNSSLLSQILDDTKDLEGWQVVLRVSELDTSSETPIKIERYSKPREIEADFRAIARTISA
jgi:hypothetical protein